ncbi:MAG: SDR family oxidoreductase, partial [Acidimicrobiia bacterium]
MDSERTGPRPDHITGKSIVVTGAGGRFGLLVCELTAARGARVVAVDIDGPAVRQLADELVAAGQQAISVECDVTDAAAMRAMARTALDTFGTIDVLVNNAGIMPLAFWADHERAIEAWDRCIDINMKGVLHGIVAVHDAMIDQGRGHIVNI